MPGLKNIYTINGSIWKYWFSFMKPVTDNVFFLILLACVSYGVTITAIRFLLFKKKGVGGVIDIAFVTSVSLMLRRLYLIHDRIHNVLKYGVYIILQSDLYMKEFQHRAGVEATKESQIAEIIYHIRPKDWERWTMAVPHQLYYRMGKAFRIARSIGGRYIDDKIPAPTYGIVAVLVVITLLLLACTSKGYLTLMQSVSVFVCMIVACSEKNRMIGTIVALLALFIVEYIINSSFVMLQAKRRSKNISKIHIKGKQNNNVTSERR